MEQLYRLLGNRFESCGMATVIVDNEGRQVLGKVLAGQALSVTQKEEKILK